jgi:hypothetical protein
MSSLSRNPREESDMNPDSARPPDPAAAEPASGARWIAGLVLVPAVPLLVASVIALAAFYSAPHRFGAWLSKLPGETYLRTALIFAPASLLAIVVMATLYLRDRSHDEPTGAQVETGLVRAARLSLLVSGPLLALTGLHRAALYLDAERVGAWLDALPGTGYLTRVLDLAPLALVLAVAIGVLLGFAPTARRPSLPPVETAAAVPPRTRARMGRLAAEVVLALATPALLFSLAGLALEVFSPERLARLLEPLPGDTYLRLLLLLAPAGLLAVLLIATLYLLGPLDPERTQPVRRADRVRLRIPEAWRSDVAMVVLLVGLVLAVAAGALLVGGVLVLLLVR